MPFFAIHLSLNSWFFFNLQISAPKPSGSAITGAPNASFCLAPRGIPVPIPPATTTRSRANTFITSSPVHRACNDKTTEQFSQYCSQSQSRAYSISSAALAFRGTSPRRWQMNSSASTDVLVSTSTRSMAMVGISDKITRRSELASGRSTARRIKSTRVALA